MKYESGERKMKYEKLGLPEDAYEQWDYPVASNQNSFLILIICSGSIFAAVVFAVLFLFLMLIGQGDIGRTIDIIFFLLVYFIGSLIESLAVINPLIL